MSGGKKVEDVEKDLSLEESFYPLRKVELPLNGWMDCQMVKTLFVVLTIGRSVLLTK